MLRGSCWIVTAVCDTTLPSCLKNALSTLFLSCKTHSQQPSSCFWLTKKKKKRRKVSLSRMQTVDLDWFYLPDLRSFDLEQLKERLYWLLRVPATWTKSFRLPLTLLKVKVSKGWRHHKSMDESGFLELFLTCLLVSAWRINHSVTGTD